MTNPFEQWAGATQPAPANPFAKFATAEPLAGSNPFSRFGFDQQSGTQKNVVTPWNIGLTSTRMGTEYIALSREEQKYQDLNRLDNAREFQRNAAAEAARTGQRATGQLIDPLTGATTGIDPILSKYDPVRDPDIARYAFTDSEEERKQIRGALEQRSREAAQSAALQMEKLAALPQDEGFNAALATGEAGAIAEAIADDPMRLWRLALQSGPQMAGAVAATPLLGPAAGAAATSYGAEYGQALIQGAIDAGYNPFDAASIQAYFKDPAALAGAREKARTGGLTVAAFDALTAGIASKMLIPKKLVSGPLAREATNIAVQAPIQAAGGAGGEALKQQLTLGGVKDPGAVYAEALGEIPGTLFEVPALGLATGRYKNADLPGPDVGAPPPSRDITASIEEIEARTPSPTAVAVEAPAAPPAAPEAPTNVGVPGEQPRSAPPPSDGEAPQETGKLQLSDLPESTKIAAGQDGVSGSPEATKLARKAATGFRLSAKAEAEGQTESAAEMRKKAQENLDLAIAKGFALERKTTPAEQAPPPVTPAPTASAPAEGGASPVPPSEAPAAATTPPAAPAAEAWTPIGGGAARYVTPTRTLHIAERNGKFIAFVRDDGVEPYRIASGFQSLEHAKAWMDEQQKIGRFPEAPNEKGYEVYSKSEPEQRIKAGVTTFPTRAEADAYAAELNQAGGAQRYSVRPIKSIFGRTTTGIKPEGLTEMVASGLQAQRLVAHHVNLSNLPFSLMQSPLYRQLQASGKKLLVNAPTVRGARSSIPYTAIARRIEKIMTPLLKRLMPDLELIIDLDPASPFKSAQNLGSHMGYGQNRAVIWLSPTALKSNITTVAVLFHEFGHTLVGHRFAHAPAHLQQAIYNKFYASIRKVQAGQKAGEFLTDMYAPANLTMVSAFARDPQAPAASELFENNQSFNEWFSFDEWMAEQVARWFTTEQRPMSLIDRFFKGTAEKLRGVLKEMWTLMRGEEPQLGDFRAPEAVKEWMNYLLENRPPAPMNLISVRESMLQGIAENAKALDEPLHQSIKAPTDPAFKAWFGDSKAVDKDGRPLVLYHGTAENVASFDESRRGTNTGAPSADEGFFFTTRPKTADYYATVNMKMMKQEGDFRVKKALEKAYKSNPLSVAKGRDAEMRQEINAMSGSNVMPVFLSLRNPFVYDYKGRVHRSETYRKIIDKAKAGGHDGVILRNTFDAGERGEFDRILQGRFKAEDVYVAFAPTQIKSAIGNNGNFDAGSPLINEQIAPPQPELQYAHEAANSLRIPGFRRALAQADRWNWFMKVWNNILQLAWSNKHIGGLQRYVESVRQWHIDKMAIITRADGRIKEWRKLGKEMGANLSAFLFDLDAMSYLPAGSNARWPTVQELVALAQKHGLNQRALNVYAGIKGDFLSILDKIETAWIKDAQRTYTDPAILAREIYNIRTEIAALRSKPYFPHERFGDFYVTVKDARGKTVHFEQVQTAKDADKLRAQLARSPQYAGSSFEVGKLPEEVKIFRGLPPSLIKMLASKMPNLTAAQQIALEHIAFSMSPANSFSKHMAKRKGTPGYSLDAMRAYANYFLHAGGHIARLTHRGDMEDAVKSVYSSARAMGATFSAKAAAKRTGIADYMQRHLDYVMNPQSEWTALRSFAFVWHLAFNVSSAVINLLQVPMVAYPYLASRFNDFTAMNQLRKASTDLGKTLRLSGNLPQDEVDAMKLGVEHGFLDESMAADLAGASQYGVLGRIVPGNQLERARQKIGYVGAWLFQAAEKVNRRVIFMAAYRMAKADPNNRHVQEVVAANQTLYQELLANGWSPSNAAAFLMGRDSIDKSMFNYSAYARPEFIRGRKGVLFAFWMFKQNMLHFFRNDPGAWRALLILGATSGLMGLPFAGDISDIVKYAARMFGKDFDPEREARQLIIDLTSEDDVGRRTAEILMHGLGKESFGLTWAGEGLGIPIPGFDLSNRLSMGNIVPGVEPLLQGAAGQLTPGESIGRTFMETVGAAYGVPLNILRAVETGDPDDFKTWERVLPAAAKNLARAYRFATEGAETNRMGAKVADFDVTDTFQAAEVVGQALGFTPTRLSREWDKQAMMRDATQYWVIRRKLMFDQFDKAFRSKDREALADAREALRQFNSDTPDPRLRISASAIIESLKARAKNRKKVEADRALQRTYQGVASEVQGLFPSDSTISSPRP